MNPSELCHAWIQRERFYRARSEKYALEGRAKESGLNLAKANAIKRCRLDLQKKFKLTKIL